MIEIKGTKTSPQENDPHERYVHKSMDKNSKTPAYVVVLLAAVGLYLKSIFPSASKTQEDPPADTPPEQDETELATSQTTTGQVAGTPTGENTEKVGSSTSLAVLDLPRPLSFTLSESPAFQFMDPSPKLEWFSPKTIIFQPVAANDNPNVSGKISASGGSGIGGGGGGSISTPGSFGPDGGSDTETGSGPGAGNGGSQQANRAPRLSGPVYLMDIASCATLAFGLSDLLRNAVDPDNDPLTVQNLQVSTGTLKPLENGWLFETDTFELGPVIVSYAVSDGQFAVEQFAYFWVVKEAPIIGTDDADMLLGTKCANEIDGAGGDDIIDAGAGNDVITGGSGNDHIVAGDGDDVVYGGTGHDIIFAGLGDDYVSGGAGNDRIFGEGGSDALFGDDGHDLIFGGDGNDRLFGGTGNDTLYGGAHNDILFGEAGHDVLHGDSGDDRIDGDAGNDDIHGGDGNDIVMDGFGNDTVAAGDGNDILVAASDGDDDHYDGGEGFDRLDYSSATDMVTINIMSGMASGAEIGSDSFSNFEHFRTGGGDDHFIVGRNNGVVMTGGDGSDVFEFSAPESTPSTLMTIAFEITDFQHGDRLRISKHDLFKEVLDEVEDRFEKVYGEEVDDDGIRLRYHDERSEELGHTVIEADLNKDGVWETTIEIAELQVLVTVEGV